MVERYLGIRILCEAFALWPFRVKIEDVGKDLPTGEGELERQRKTPRNASRI
jgi:hypothetical protein